MEEPLPTNIEDNVKRRGSWKGKYLFSSGLRTEHWLGMSCSQGFISPLTCSLVWLLELPDSNGMPGEPQLVEAAGQAPELLHKVDRFLPPKRAWTHGRGEAEILILKRDLLFLTQRHSALAKTCDVLPKGGTQNSQKSARSAETSLREYQKGSGRNCVGSQHEMEEILGKF